MRVVRLTLAPVKGLALHHPDEVFLGRHGIPGDRRFYLTDQDGRLVNDKTCGEIIQVRPSVANGSLSLAFPDRVAVEGRVELGAAVETSFYGRPVTGRSVEGPFSDVISDFAGRPLRLVQADEEGSAIDRVHVVSIVSDGSLRALARHAGVDWVDGRRFRMNIELEGCDEHEEDSWIGREVRVGEARIRVTGPVGRCVVTTRNPDSGISDLDTLKALAGYRTLKEGKSFGCGVCGDVLEPGTVRVGDSLLRGD
jgi:uncharacterized protein YcbX